MRTFFLAVPVLALTTNPALAGQLRFEEALARALSVRFGFAVHFAIATSAVNIDPAG